MRRANVRYLHDVWTEEKRNLLGIFILPMEDGTNELHSLDQVHPLQVWSEETQTWILIDYKLSA